MARDSILPIVTYAHPKEGRRSVQFTVDLTNLSAVVDLVATAMMGQISQICSLFFDNADNSFAVTIVMEGTLQRIVCPPNSQGYVRLLLPQKPRLGFSSAQACQFKVNLLNWEVLEAEIWSASSVAFIPLIPEPKNTVLAGPVTGADANPTFRTLVTADLNSVAGQIPATATNNNAVAGNVGEEIKSVLPNSSGVALVSGPTQNITSIVLTPGDWEVCAAPALFPNGSAMTSVTCGISLVSNTLPSVITDAMGTTELSCAFTVSASTVMNIAPLRFSVSVNTTVYLVAAATFTGGVGVTAWGTLRARRAR